MNVRDRKNASTADPSRRGSEERFKIGLVSLLICGSIMFNFHTHAEASGLPAFNADTLTTVPAYGLLTLMTVILLVAVVINKLEPGVFEQDKAGGSKRSTRGRPKRA